MNDHFHATLDSGKVSLKLDSQNSNYLFKVTDQKRSEQSISQTETRVTYAFTLKAISDLLIQGNIRGRLH